MFSEHLKKFDEMPYRTLLMVAAGLVFVCQLAAFAFVADAQVTKAKIRDYQRTVEMQAIAHCMETAPVPARQRCIQEARVMASSAVPPAAGAAPEAQALADAPDESNGVMASNETGVSGMLPTQPAQGFMAASFAFR